MARFTKSAAGIVAATGAVAPVTAAMSATWAAPGDTVANEPSTIVEYRAGIKTTPWVRQSDGAHLIGGN